MLLLLALVLWLTIAGANVPSQLLGTLLFRMEAWLRAGMMRLSKSLRLRQAEPYHAQGARVQRRRSDRRTNH